VLVLDLINPENVDDDENEGGRPMGSLVIVLVLWHPAGFIADDNLGAATAEASPPERPVPMLPPVTTAILPAKLN
jgi:hypothetical protein